MHLSSSHINLVGRPAPARDPPYGQGIRDHDSHIPLGVELPRSRHSRRTRSASPRTSRVRDAEVEEVVRYDAVARRRPRDPETDVIASEIETKRRRLGSLRESDRPLPSNTSQYSSAEKSESLHKFPTGESRTYCELEVPQAISVDRPVPLLFVCRPKTTAVATTEEPIQRINEFSRPRATPDTVT